jgi:hypothetical protein
MWTVDRPVSWTQRARRDHSGVTAYRLPDDYPARCGFRHDGPVRQDRLPVAHDAVVRGATDRVNSRRVHSLTECQAVGIHQCHVIPRWECSSAIYRPRMTHSIENVNQLPLEVLPITFRKIRSNDGIVSEAQQPSRPCTALSRGHPGEDPVPLTPGRRAGASQDDRPETRCTSHCEASA